MKLEKLDHKHALTSWLKVILFACLMLAPIMSVVVRSLYVVCNKNAKDSYYGETINEETYNRYSFSQLELNKDYYLTNDLITQLNTQQYTDTYFVVDNLKIDDVVKENVNRLRFYYTNSYAVIQLYNNTTATGDSYNLVNNSYTFEFTYLGYIGDTNILSVFDNMIYTISYNKDSYLDNVFDYSISQIEQSQFYNWTQNTAIYTGVEAMTTGLGITGATVPILITYWFLLTIIYIVIDIVLNLFTYITHYLNKKVE